MVRRISQGAPDVVCLQEVPVWALDHLAAWSGMAAFGAVAMPARGGALARRLTELDPRRLRSALTGQANAILVSPGLTSDGQETLFLNPPSFRGREASRLRLPLPVRLAWSRNRRVAQLVRVADAVTSAVVVNLHLTSLRTSGPADAELLRAATYAEGFAAPGEPLVIAGDLNLTRSGSPALRELERWGFTTAGEGIDHIVVRGLTFARGPERWPDARRRLGMLLLSDHAPFEAEMMSV